MTKATNTTSDIQKWREDRSEIKEAHSVEELKLQLVLDRRKVDRIDRDAFEVTLGCTRLTADTTKACGPVLPIVQALAAAQRRDDLTRKISDAEGQNSTAEGQKKSTPIITSVDPQAETVPKLVAWITRGRFAPTPDDIALVRLLGPTMVPSLAGLLLMFGSTLWAPRTTSHD